jgi:hypothetical protein
MGLFGSSQQMLRDRRLSPTEDWLLQNGIIDPLTPGEVRRLRESLFTSSGRSNGLFGSRTTRKVPAGVMQEIAGNWYTNAPAPVSDQNLTQPAYPPRSIPRTTGDTKGSRLDALSGSPGFNRAAEDFALRAYGPTANERNMLLQGARPGHFNTSRMRSAAISDAQVRPSAARVRADEAAANRRIAPTGRPGGNAADAPTAVKPQPVAEQTLGGRARLVESPIGGIRFKDEMPEGVASKLKPEQLARYLEMATDLKSTPEQLSALMKGFGYDLANADAIVEARDKGLGVNKEPDYRPRKIPKNPDGAGGAAARGFGDPINLLDEIGAVADTLGATSGRENIWSSDRPFLDVLNSNIDENRSILQADERDHFGARVGGQLASSLLLPIGNKAHTAGQLAKWGAAEGTLAGFGAGEGNPLQRAPNAVVGGGLGYAGGYFLGRGIEAVSPLFPRAFRGPGDGFEAAPLDQTFHRGASPSDVRFTDGGANPNVGPSATPDDLLSQQTVVNRRDQTGLADQDGELPTGQSDQSPLFDMADATVEGSQLAIDTIGVGGVKVNEIGSLGPVLDGLQGRWKETVEVLSRLRSGDARGVLTHPDVPTPIDVVWAGGKRGLQRIMEEHPEIVEDLPEQLAKMRAYQVGRNRIRLRSADARAVVRLDFDGGTKTWLLTAFKPNNSSNLPARRR